MVTQPAPRRRFAAKLVKIAVAWWLVSVVFSLLSLQPFEHFLVRQSESALLKAYDPFVLWVTLQREQGVLASAVATCAAVLLVYKVCSQVPYTLVLVALRPGAPAQKTATLLVLRALPYVTALSLIAEGVPLALVYVATRATRGWTNLLDATPGTLVSVCLAALTLLGIGLFFLTVLDFARIAVVLARHPSVRQGLNDGAAVVLRAPVRLFLRSTLARGASLVCLGATMACSVGLLHTNDATTSWAAWVVAQAGVLLSMAVRVAWLGYATRYAHYSLRPPSRNN